MLAPSASFAETVEPSASFSVAFLMSPFALQVQIPVLVRWEQNRVEGSVMIPELVTEPLVAVLVSIEWFCLLPILPPAILPVARVSGNVIASVLPAGFPNSEVETNGVTNATSDINFATSWKNSSCPPIVWKALAEDEYSPKYDRRVSLSIF